jgi:hypothetical protein
VWLVRIASGLPTIRPESQTLVFPQSEFDSFTLQPRAL